MPLGTTNLEVEFQLCWLFSSSWDAPECTAWPSLKQPGPGEANRGPPQWALSVLCGTSVLCSTSCLGGEWGRRVLNIRATNPTPGSYRRDLIDACSLYSISCWLNICVCFQEEKKSKVYELNHDWLNGHYPFNQGNVHAALLEVSSFPLWELLISVV